jgi:phospholipase/carboxylesterase
MINFVAGFDRPSLGSCLALAAWSVLAVLLPGCGVTEGPPRPAPGGPSDGEVDTVTKEPGRLTTRPHGPTQTKPEYGLRPLKIDGVGHGLMYVPRSYREERPAPLAITLHGAGGDSRGGMGPFLRVAEKFNLILISPKSREGTWDLLRGGFGADVGFIDRAMKIAFDRYAIDADRVGIQGFSDGASYALSLGITNGDLFTHIVAFSPGFAAPNGRHGSPKIFMSHGTEDSVLPIDQTSRKIAPRLRDGGYKVRYEEFAGSHRPQRDISHEAAEWFTGR